jgi:hypothetical protein
MMNIPNRWNGIDPSTRDLLHRLANSNQDRELIFSDLEDELITYQGELKSKVQREISKARNDYVKRNVGLYFHRIANSKTDPGDLIGQVYNAIKTIKGKNRLELEIRLIEAEATYLRKAN